MTVTGMAIVRAVPESVSPASPALGLEEQGYSNQPAATVAPWVNPGKGATPNQREQVLSS